MLVSLVAMNYHFVSDVIAGGVLGGIVATVRRAFGTAANIVISFAQVFQYAFAIAGYSAGPAGSRLFCGYSVDGDVDWRPRRIQGMDCS